MKIKHLLLIVLVTNLYTAISQDTLIHSVYFDVDQFELKNNEKEKLDVFLKSVDLLNLISIELTGHTDSDGSLAYNQKLSQNRVKTVADYFTELKLTTTSSVEYGELKPVDDNSKEEGKAKNRRVEVKIIVQTPPIIQVEDIQELYKKLEQKRQTFCIDPNRDTILRLEQGTIISIRAGTFINQKGCVKVSAKEVYKKSDMLLENLTTVSNGKQLESGGMVYLEATNIAGKPVVPKKEIAIFLPTQDYQEDMKLFKGNRDPHQAMNWTGIDAQVLPFNLDIFNQCDSYAQLQRCGDRCFFFFCRIKRFKLAVKGISDSLQRQDNKDFRDCQRSLRRRGANSNLYNDLYFKCDSIYKLMETYGVSNYAELQMKMNQQLMDSLGLTTYTELQNELEKQRIRKIESDIVNGKSSVETLSYYSFQTKQMGWINCDRFSNQSGVKISMVTPVRIREDKDCKLVFDKIRSVMAPSYSEKSTYRFDNIPKNAPVHLVFLRYEDKKIYLSIIQMKVQDKTPEPNWKEVTLEELKEAFKQFD